MKVKLFDRLEHGEGIDADINAWLSENPNVKVLGMELSTHVLETDRGLPELMVVCMLLYDEA